MIRLALGAAGPTSALLILLWRTRARECGPAVCCCAACALGLGVSSLLWWQLLQLPIHSTTALVSIDLAIWAAIVTGLAVGLPRTPRTEAPSGLTAPAGDGGQQPDAQHEGLERTPPRGRPGLPGVLAAWMVLLPLCGLAVVSFAARCAVEAHGTWDAWATWNVRARFLFEGFPSAWTDAFAAPPIAGSDYPLLLPASIARAWTLAGRESTAVPIALAAMFAAGVVIVAGASIRRERTASRGLLTSAFILASPAFVGWAPSQCADVPLSLYLLLTFVFVAEAMKAGRSGSLWAFAGLAAGLAAWTKNEGIVLVAAAFAVTMLWAWRGAAGRPRWMPLAAFTLGAAPAILVLVAFKRAYAPPNIMISIQSGDHLLRLLSPDRISMVLGAMGRQIWYGGASTIGVLPLLAGYVAMAGVAGREWRMASATLLTLALMFSAYAVVYVLTPLDLAWHLSTSVDRVVLQLTPSLVWAGMLLTVPRRQ